MSSPQAQFGSEILTGTEADIFRLLNDVLQLSVVRDVLAADQPTRGAGVRRTFLAKVEKLRRTASESELLPGSDDGLTPDGLSTRAMALVAAAFLIPLLPIEHATSICGTGASFREASRQVAHNIALPKSDFPFIDTVLTLLAQGSQRTEQGLLVKVLAAYSEKVLPGSQEAAKLLQNHVEPVIPSLRKLFTTAYEMHDMSLLFQVGKLLLLLTHDGPVISLSLARSTHFVHCLLAAALSDEQAAPEASSVSSRCLALGLLANLLDGSRLSKNNDEPPHLSNLSAHCQRLCVRFDRLSSILPDSADDGISLELACLSITLALMLCGGGNATSRCQSTAADVQRNAELVSILTSIRAQHDESADEAGGHALPAVQTSEKLLRLIERLGGSVS